MVPPLLRRAGFYVALTLNAPFLARAVTFEIVYEDMMALPPGVIGDNLMNTTASSFRVMLRQLLSGTLALGEGHPKQFDTTITNAEVLDDTNATAVNGHGGIHHGK